MQSFKTMYLIDKMNITMQFNKCANTKIVKRLLKYKVEVKPKPRGSINYVMKASEVDHLHTKEYTKYASINTTYSLFISIIIFEAVSIMCPIDMMIIFNAIYLFVL